MKWKTYFLLTFLYASFPISHAGVRKRCLHIIQLLLTFLQPHQTCCMDHNFKVTLIILGLVGVVPLCICPHNLAMWQMMEAKQHQNAASLWVWSRFNTLVWHGFNACLWSCLTLLKIHSHILAQVGGLLRPPENGLIGSKEWQGCTGGIL